jgi:isoaspartyl peptidase/L-asparaginase-like protein (Ntn-hydrolase superfamily)
MPNPFSGLSPRVIVVWFQNARQKARKVFEQQPHLMAQHSVAAAAAAAASAEHQQVHFIFTCIIIRPNFE